MTNRSPRTPAAPHDSPAQSDEDSRVRERTQASPAAGRKYDPGFSLDERLESKLAEAAALLAKLEPQDARARLLHIAMLRRDEALLDGIVAELALPRRTTRRTC